MKPTICSAKEKMGKETRKRLYYLQNVIFGQIPRVERVNRLRP